MSEPTNERPKGDDDQPVYEPAEGEPGPDLLDGDEAEGAPGVAQRMDPPDPSDAVDGIRQAAAPPTPGAPIPVPER